jgi:hypothetical protein
MFSHPIYYHKPSALSTRSTFLKHLSPGTLALVMFIAVALLGIVGGKESETKKPVPGESAMTAIRSAPYDKPSRLTPLHSIGTMLSAFKEVFNEPSLIEYANQQGVEILDSPTPPIVSGSSRQSPCSKSALAQSPTLPSDDERDQIQTNNLGKITAVCF